MATHRTTPRRSPTNASLSSSSPPPAPTSRRTVAFTTPAHYADRLSHLISLRQWTPLWSPTITVSSTPETTSNLLHFLLQPTAPTPPPLNSFSALAFTSRAGISAFLSALDLTQTPPLSPSPSSSFTVAALGKDAELLNADFLLRLCGTSSSDRVRVLVPPVASPTGLVTALGKGMGRRVLCPVPRVVGLEEPDVVPGFLRELGRAGWEAARVDAYETRWAGPGCVEGLLGSGGVDAVVFTSTAEVEGLVKGLREFVGMSWAEFRKECGCRDGRPVVVAAHGPVTGAGAERLGVGVDVVSERFGSFEGVVRALAVAWGEEKKSDC